MLKSILIVTQFIPCIAQIQRSLKYSDYSNYFEKYIDIIIISVFVFTIVFNFINSLNYSKKKNINYYSESNNYNIQLSRPSYNALFLLLVSYSQYVSVLSLLNINTANYINLYNLSKKLDYVNLWNINILKVNNTECPQLNFFFQNHFIFIVGLIGITIINVLIVTLFNLFYKSKVICNENSNTNIITLGYTTKNTNYNKKHTATIESQESQNNIIIPSKSNYKDFNIIIKNNYLLFPYMQLSWIHFALLGLITSEIIMLKKNCVNYIIISIGALIIVPILYIMYVIATLYNKIKCKEDIIYILKANVDTITIKKKYRSFIELFDKGYWFSQNHIKFSKSHIPLYVDFERKNIHYNIFSFIKITIFAIIVAQSNIKNLNTTLYIISVLYIIDTIIMLIMRPFRNIFITFMNLLVNISYTTSLLLIIYTNSDKYIMYLIDYTFISLISLIIIEVLTCTIYKFIQ